VAKGLALGGARECGREARYLFVLYSLAWREPCDGHRLLAFPWDAQYAHSLARALCASLLRTGVPMTLDWGPARHRTETKQRHAQCSCSTRTRTAHTCFSASCPLLHLPTGRAAASRPAGWLALLWVPAAATDRRDGCDGERGACVGAIGDEHGDALQWSQHASTGVHCRIRRATTQPVGAAAASKKAASGARAANQQRAGGPRQEQLCSPRRNKAHCKGGKQQQQLP